MAHIVSVETFGAAPYKIPFERLAAAPELARFLVMRPDLAEPPAPGAPRQQLVIPMFPTQFENLWHKPAVEIVLEATETDTGASAAEPPAPAQPPREPETAAEELDALLADLKTWRRSTLGFLGRCGRRYSQLEAALDDIRGRLVRTLVAGDAVRLGVQVHDLAGQIVHGRRAEALRLLTRLVDAGGEAAAHELVRALHEEAVAAFRLI